jgi:regulator of sirC expression with transglutaminase-like and TPR domain
MADRTAPRERFRAIAELPDYQIDVAEAALWIAAEEQPGLHPAPWLDRLDELGEHVRPRLRGVRDELDRLDVLTEFLFLEEGLRGNSENYYDPRNSYLNEVLHRRLGIPISLAVVCIEVGKRAGVPLEGVGFPGHFLLRLARHPEVVVDPFDQGRILTVDDCQEMLSKVTRGSVDFDPALLRPVGPRQILQRMLNNLRGIYLHRGEHEKTISVLDRLLLLDPEDPGPLRDRGVLHIRWGDPERGVEDLEAYLTAADGAVADQEEIAYLISETRRRMTIVN